MKGGSRVLLDIKMKKIVIMSDNHGDQTMIDYVKEHEPHGDYYIHCGDSEAIDKRILNGFICVKGNNDWSLDLPKEARLNVEGVPIFITHGQYFGYFNRELAMNDLLTRHHCRVLISGHTHMPMFEKDGDFYYINPGSTTLPRGGSDRSYGVLLIDNGKLDFRLKKIQK